MVCANTSAKFKIYLLFACVVFGDSSVQRNTVTPRYAFALVSVGVFVVTTGKFLSKETSGIFVIQIALIPKLYLPVFTTICSVLGGSLLQLMGAGKR